MTVTLDIVTTAALLFVVATGLLVIFGVLKIINFAHGAFLTVGAYGALVTTTFGLNPWLSFPLAFVTGAIVGCLVERLVVRPLYDRPLDAILATWGLGIVISQFITLGFGREIQFARSPLSGTIQSSGKTYSAYRLVALAIAIAVGLGFAALIEGTRLGLSARAVIMNDDLARGLGIDTLSGATHDLCSRLRPCGIGRCADHTVVKRRPQHGRAMADQRLYAGDGSRFVVS